MTQEANVAVDDKLIIKEEDLAVACDTDFLKKMQEFARRGKEAKIPEHIVKLYQLSFEITFPEMEDELCFSNLSSYRLHIQPFTEQDMEKIEEARQKQDGKEPASGE